MIVPFLLGLITGRFVGRRVIAVVLGLVIGVAMGVVSGLEIVPLLYPFMIVQIPWVGVPEIRRIGLSLITPDFVLLDESVHFLSYSFTFMSTLLVISVVGSILGIIIGKRYRPSEIDSPWKAADQDM